MHRPLDPRALPALVAGCVAGGLGLAAAAGAHSLAGLAAGLAGLVAGAFSLPLLGRLRALEGSEVGSRADPTSAPDDDSAATTTTAMSDNRVRPGRRRTDRLAPEGSPPTRPGRSSEPRPLSRAERTVPPRPEIERSPPGIVTVGGTAAGPSLPALHVAVGARLAVARRHLWPVAVVQLVVLSGPTPGGEPPTDLGRALRHTLRESDSLFEVGDHHWVLVLEDTDEQGGIWAVERLHDALEPKGLVRLAAGIACYPSHALEVEGILEGSALALTAALARSLQGGNRAVEVAPIETTT